jgi:hypothetical protein
MQKRLKLVVDVTYDDAEGQETRLQRNLEEMVDWAMGEGSLTDCAGEATVHRYTANVSELDVPSSEVVHRQGERALMEDGRMLARVDVDVVNMLASNDDLYEEFLTVLSKRATGTDFLEDIRYQVIDVEDGILRVEVEGDLGTILGMEEEDRAVITPLLAEAEKKALSDATKG